MRNDIRNGYFEHLVSLVCDGGPCDHRILLGELFDMEFYSSVDNDSNRDEDGRDLRCDWADAPEGPARVLEVFTALAVRMDIELDGWKDAKQISGYFWEIINNMDLMRYTNEYIMTNPDQIIAEIRDILRDTLDRTYEKSVPFPSKLAKSRMKRMELWYQMFAYINENYSID